MHVEKIALPVRDADLTGEFAQRLGNSLKATGFTILNNHPIPDWLLRAAYIVAADLFRYTDLFLQPYQHPELGHQVGATPFGREHAKNQSADMHDLKRFWQIQRSYPLGHPARTTSTLTNVWPDHIVPEFRDVMQELFRRMEELGMQLLKTLDAYLGWNNQLQDMAADGPTLMRVLHYPPVTQGAQGQRSAPHEDINLITLLVAGTETGLELLGRDRIWHPVAEEPGSIVINVGDMLQELTNGNLPSASHRVVNPPADANNHRYSIPFFVHPRPEVTLNAQTGLTAGTFLRRRLEEIGLS